MWICSAVVCTPRSLCISRFQKCTPIYKHASQTRPRHKLTHTEPRQRLAPRTQLYPWPLKVNVLNLANSSVQTLVMDRTEIRPPF